MNPGMKHKVLIVTGAIGSGKTSLTKVFEEYGFPVYSADDYSRDIYKGRLLEEIKEYFPDAISGGEVDRRKLREIISNSEDKRLILNSLTHGQIIRKLADDINQSPSLVEIPLYSEVVDFVSEYFDVIGVIYVDAEYDIRLKRIIKRDKISLEQADKIIKSQIYDGKNKELSNRVIYNNTDLSALEAQLDPVFEVLNESF